MLARKTVGLRCELDENGLTVSQQLCVPLLKLLGEKLFP
jgi:hypothetical protein